jgi:hypothetical protein
MKLIEALKKIKDLKRKADDIQAKVAGNCAMLDCETAPYPDTKRQVSEWLQAHSDIIKEILHLKVSIARTNLATQVSIELGGKHVKKCITEWIERRKELAKMQESCWKGLTSRGLEDEYKRKMTQNSPELTVKRVLFFDPVERDIKVELYRSEPSVIDSTLEVVNCVTDLIES